MILWNFMKEVTKFVSDGCSLVSKEQYQERLTICNTCPFREGKKCTKCGCAIHLKAKGKAFNCPEGKWPEVD